MDYQEFFIEFGRLLYAIAKSDGKVQKPELEKIRQIVKEQLTKMDDSSDAFGTPAAFYLEFEFERLLDFEVKIRDAYDSFLGFATENKAFFTADIKKLVINTSEKVAYAFNGVEDAEQALLNSLKRHLQNL
jgi:tellurite resistance protein